MSEASLGLTTYENGAAVVLAAASQKLFMKNILTIARKRAIENAQDSKVEKLGFLLSDKVMDKIGDGTVSFEGTMSKSFVDGSLYIGIPFSTKGGDQIAEDVNITGDFTVEYPAYDQQSFTISKVLDTPITIVGDKADDASVATILDSLFNVTSEADISKVVTALAAMFKYNTATKKYDPTFLVSSYQGVLTYRSTQTAFKDYIIQQPYSAGYSNFSSLIGDIVYTEDVWNDLTDNDRKPIMIMGMVRDKTSITAGNEDIKSWMYDLVNDASDDTELMNALITIKDNLGSWLVNGDVVPTHKFTGNVHTVTYQAQESLKDFIGEFSLVFPKTPAVITLKPETRYSLLQNESYIDKNFKAIYTQENGNTLADVNVALDGIYKLNTDKVELNITGITYDDSDNTTRFGQKGGSIYSSVTIKQMSNRGLLTNAVTVINTTPTLNDGITEQEFSDALAIESESLGYIFKTLYTDDTALSDSNIWNLIDRPGSILPQYVAKDSITTDLPDKASLTDTKVITRALADPYNSEVTVTIGMYNDNIAVIVESLDIDDYAGWMLPLSAITSINNIVIPGSDQVDYDYIAYSMTNFMATAMVFQDRSGDGLNVDITSADDTPTYTYSNQHQINKNIKIAATAINKPHINTLISGEFYSVDSDAVLANGESEDVEKGELYVMSNAIGIGLKTWYHTPNNVSFNGIKAMIEAVSLKVDSVFTANESIIINPDIAIDGLTLVTTKDIPIGEAPDNHVFTATIGLDIKSGFVVSISSEDYYGRAGFVLPMPYVTDLGGVLGDDLIIPTESIKYIPEYIAPLAMVLQGDNTSEDITNTVKDDTYTFVNTKQMDNVALTAQKKS